VPSDALRLEPTSVDVLVARATVLFLTGKLPDALKNAAEALRLDPGSEAAQRIRRRVKDVERLKEEGNTAFKSGRLQEAVARYSESLDVRPLKVSRERVLKNIAANRRRGGRGQGRADSRYAPFKPRHNLSEGAFSPFVASPFSCRPARAAR
jgi:tetratricopeptide (TPR) repeat protein